MAILQPYTTGTVSVTQGETTVTGSGTAWKTAGFQAGDQFWATGLTVTIATVDSDTQVTLASGWPGSTISGGSYELRAIAVGDRANADFIKILKSLASGNLPAIADLESAADKLAYFDGAGTADLADFPASARSLLALTAAADKLAYFDGAGTADLADFPASARSLLALAASADKLAYFDGSDTAKLTALTTFARTLLDDADAGAALTTLGVSSFIQTLLDDADAATALATLGAFASSGGTVSGGLTVKDSSGTSNLNIQRSDDAARVQMNMMNAAGETCFQIFVNGGEERAWLYNKTTGLGIFQDNGDLSLSHNLAVSGSLSKGSGTFLIDHPLDPENRDLAHGFVEAPRYDLIYRGTVNLVNGKATVDIDAASSMTAGTFAALVTNAVVASLQNQDGFARVKPGAISGASFDILCEDDTCTDEIAWVVIAERNDLFVKSDIDPNTDENGRFIPDREKEVAQ